MASIGNILRETRHARGLSLLDLEDVTKIRTQYLRALEEEQFEQLPGRTYVIGFLRSYAKALGLDAQELVDSYKATLTPQEDPIKPIEPVDPALVIRRPVTRGLLIIGLCILALATLFGVNSLWNNNADQPPASSQIPAAPSSKANPQPGEQPEQQAQPQPAQVVTPAPQAQEATGLTLDLNFTAKCWVSVKADGKPVLEGTFTAGDSKNIKAQDKIELHVGNAGGLQLVLNGKAFPSLGPDGQVRTKVITKQDITQ